MKPNRYARPRLAIMAVAANGLVTLPGRRLCLNEILAWMTLPAALGTLVLLRVPYAKEECSDAG